MTCRELAVTNIFSAVTANGKQRSLCTGEAWQESIRASPAVYQSSYQAETATLDTGKQ